MQTIEKIAGEAGLLYSPIFGSDSFFDRLCAKQVDKVLSCQERLSDLADPQVEFHLLLSCLSIC